MKTLILSLACLASAFAQTAKYPGAVATNTQLRVAVNASATPATTLAVAMGPTDLSFQVAAGSAIPINGLATVCSQSTAAGCTAIEIVAVCNVVGNVITVGYSACPNIDGRAFDSSTAAFHPLGSAVYINMDAWHINATNAEIKAIETALGPNLSNVNALSGAQLVASKFAFTPQTPGGSLIIGANAVVMTPVPVGVNGTDTSHRLYVSAGTGVAESCLITGGSGTSGAGTGTIIITCANTHSGAWTIQSATVGIEEAAWSLAGGAGTVVVPGSSAVSLTPELYGPNVVLIDQRARLAAGTHTTGLYSILGNSATPEVDESISQSAAYIINQELVAGYKMLAGSQEYEASAMLGVCENYGGQLLVGAATQNACVAMKTIGRAFTDNSPVWGANITAFSEPGVSAPVHGIEIDTGTYVDDAPTHTVNAIELQHGGTKLAGYAMIVNGQTGSGAYFKQGVAFGISSIAPNGIAFHVYTQTNNISTGLLLEGTYNNAAVDIANGQNIRLRATSGTDALIGTYGGNNFYLQTPSAGTTQILDSGGGVMFSASGLIAAPTYKLNGLPATPGSKQPVCVDTSTGQLYHATAGVC